MLHLERLARHVNSEAWLRSVVCHVSASVAGSKKRNRNDRSTVLSGTSLTQVTHSPPGSKGICPPARWRNVFIFAVYFVLTHKGDM